MGKRWLGSRALASTGRVFHITRKDTGFKVDKKIISLLILAILSSFALAGCHSTIAPPDEEPPPAIYRKISAAEAYQKMIEEDAIILDVRTEEEYREIRIAGAVLVPDYEINSRADSLLPDKNALILVYCRSGRRSENAANELLSLGYTNVYDFGGIIDWTYETISDTP